MTSPTKYFISNINGVFINWYSNVLGLEVRGQSIEVLGGTGNDAVYVGAGTEADLTGLTSSAGSDIIYLTGNFSDYSQQRSGATYTLTRTVSLNNGEEDVDYTESVSFSVSDGDKAVFADGAIDIGYGDLLDAGSFVELSSDMLDGDITTPASPFDSSLQAVADGGETKVFISDVNGENIAAGIRGSVYAVTGGTGDDTVYVGAGTTVNAGALTSSAGSDSIYMQGNFADYDHSNAGVNYTVTRTVDIDGTDFTESVTFQVSDGDKIYFADGYIDIGFSNLGTSDGFQPLIETMLNTSEINPIVESVTISGAEPDGTAGNTDTLIIGDQVLVTVMTNKPITVDTSGGVPTYTINIGGVDREATYVSGSGGNTLVFSYTIIEDDLDLEGGITGTVDALSLANGALTDNDGLSLDLATPTIDEDANRIQVDAEIPIIESLDVSIDGTVNGSDTLAAVTFSGTTTGVEDGQSITVVIGGQSVSVDVENNAFTGTVDLSEVADNEALAVSATVSDLAGNAATPYSESIVLDTVAPTASTTPITGDDFGDAGYGHNDIITLQFSEPVDTDYLTLDVLNANLSNGHSFGTAGNGASVSASNAANGGATVFVITLGSDASVDVNDVLTLPASVVVDVNDNEAEAEVVFTIPIPASGPTAALTEAIDVTDADVDGSYSAQDTITISFSGPVLVANLTLSQFELSANDFGTGATVTAVDASGAYASSFVITLGENPTVTQSDQISVPAASVVDESGRAATEDVTFNLLDITPASTAQVNAIVANDRDGNSGFSEGDTLTVTFDEAVNINELTTDVANVFSILGGNHLGAGFSVAAVGGANGFSTQFTITLGTDPTLVATDTLNVANARVLDAAGNSPSAGLTFSVPSVLTPAANTAASVAQADTDSNGIYGAEDTITVRFNKPINTSLSIEDFSIAGKTFGAGATLTAGTESPAGYATEFTITLKAGTTVSEGDQISVDGTQVIDNTGTTATGNVVFIVSDITPPEASGDAVPGDVGAGNEGAYDEGDTLTINFSEAIDISEIANGDLGSTINLSGTGTTFGVDATIVATNAVGGFATQFIITLGADTDVTSGDTITVDAAQVVDGSGNQATQPQTFDVPTVSVPTIVSVTVPDGNYESGDEIVVTVNFSELVDVDLGGGTMTLSLNVGGSEVMAEYTGGSGSSALTFSYSASGAIDSDGITVLSNSIDTGVGTIQNASSEDAALSYAEQTFSDATVDAPFDLSMVTSLWYDATDIDGDGDTTDQNAGDAVTRLVDKSGNGNDLTQASGRGAPELQVSDTSNGNLSLYFDANTDGLSAGQDPNLGNQGYTYFVSAAVPNGHANYGSLFSTKSLGEDGVAALVRPGADGYHLHSFNTVTENSANGQDLNRGATIDNSRSLLVSDSALPGQSRTFSNNGNEQALPVITDLTPGTDITLGYQNGTSWQLEDAYINEVLYFKRALSSAEKRVVENYLTAKWDNDLTSDKDYYSGDISTNGDYDLGVTGILKLSDSNVASGSQGGLTITNGNTDGYLKDTGDAVFAGYKGLGTSADDLPTTGASNVRSDTVWYFDATDAATAGGTINLSFDLDQLGLVVTGSSDDYVLLWRSNETGQFYEIAVANSLAGNSISFDAIEVDTSATDGLIQTSTNLINDGYFTVGAVDHSAPVYESSEVDIGGNTVTLTFNKTLNSDAIPDVSAFTVDVGGNRAVTHVAIVGQHVILTIAGAAMTGDDNVTVRYVQPATGIVLEDVQGNTSAAEMIIVGSTGDDRIEMSSFNETIDDNEGSDTYIYNSTSDSRTDAITSTDTIRNFESSDSGDRINLSELLSYGVTDNLSDFVQVLGGDVEGGDVILNIDKDGASDFGAPDQVIVLTGLGSSSTPVTLDVLVANNSLLRLAIGELNIASDAVVNRAEVENGFTITGITIGLEAGDEVIVSLNGESYTAITEADGSWVATVNNADAANLNDGDTYTVTVNASDADGNSASQVSQTITVDRSAPINTVVMDEVITALPTITGQTLEDSVEVRLDTDNDGDYDDGTYTVSVSDGSWSLDLATANAQGQSSPLRFEDISASSLGVQVTATDGAGNTTVRESSLAKEATTFSISDSRVIEGETGTKTMTFIVTRDGDLSSDGSVQYAIDTNLSLAKSGGDANGVDDDYTGATSGTVSFATGESFKEVTLTVNGDYFKELNQKIVMELTDPTGGIISKATGIGEITEVDTSAMTGAFSLNDINLDLVTNAIRVRRSSDDSEIDIGFDQYGNLDTQALLKFVNDNDTGEAVSGAQGYVTIWYDQSSQQEHLIQVNSSKQGVIVNNGSLVTHSNGAATISFNQTLNGSSDDMMKMTGTGGTSTNLEVYSTFEYNSTNTGMLFNLGPNTDAGRVSVHAPHNGTTYWDAGSTNVDNGRLSADNVQTRNQVHQLVFAANYNYETAGTVEQNRVDAQQGLYVDGEVKASGDALSGTSLSLGNTWYLASGGDSAGRFYQAGKISEFLIYTSDSMTPASGPTELIGNDVHNTFTYAVESGLNRIDGQAGYDTVSLSGAGTDLDATSVTLESIEFIHMRNGEVNQLTINDAQLNHNGVVVNVLMDEGDIVIYEGSTLSHTTESQEVVTFGTEAGDRINMSLFNETVYSRGGNDVFVYHSWSDARSDGVISKDTIADFTMGASADADHLDLSDLLSLTESDTLSDFIQVLGGDVEGGDVTINIDKDGSNQFGAPDQVIVLTGVGSTSAPVTLDLLNSDNIVL